MKPETHRDTRTSARAKDRSLCIVGARGLQNELLAYFLRRETRMECLVAEDLDLVRKTVKESHPTLSLLLLDCLGKDPRALFATIRAEAGQETENCYLALFNVQDQGIVEDAVALGVRGFFYEHERLEQFPRGIRAIFDGHLWLSREMMTQYFLRDSKGDKKDDGPAKFETTLTRREEEFLRGIATGASNDALADRFCISPHTVKTHVYNIFKKISVPNRVQAARWAEKNLEAR